MYRAVKRAGAAGGARALPGQGKADPAAHPRVEALDAADVQQPGAVLLRLRHQNLRAAKGAAEVVRGAGASAWPACARDLSEAAKGKAESARRGGEAEDRLCRRCAATATARRRCERARAHEFGEPRGSWSYGVRPSSQLAPSGFARRRWRGRGALQAQRAGQRFPLPILCPADGVEPVDGVLPDLGFVEGCKAVLPKSVAVRGARLVPEGFANRNADLDVCCWNHIVLDISAQSHVDAATDAAWSEGEEHMAKLSVNAMIGAWTLRSWRRPQLVLVVHSPVEGGEKSMVWNFV